MYPAKRKGAPSATFCMNRRCYRLPEGGKFHGAVQDLAFLGGIVGDRLVLTMTLARQQGAINAQFHRFGR